MSGLAIDELFVHNHSYGFVAGWTRAPLFVGAQVETKVWIGDLDISISQSHLFGAYNSVSADIDEVVRMRPFTLPVWSAGNAAGIGPNDLPGSEWLEVYQNFQFHSDGYYYTWNDGIAGFHNGTYFWPASAVTAYSSSDHAVNMDSAASPTSISGMPAENGGTSGFDSVPHGYGVAKNVLTVGSQQNWTGSISGFSSRGPVDDGRVKPDIVTVGEEVRTSTATSDTSYGYSWGTSFSAPAVAGGIHLLSEHQNALWGDLEPLLSSTYRALVVHTAQDLGSPGPNYTYGWGAARFGHAAGVIENNYNSGQRTFLKEVVLPDQEEISFTIRAAGGGEIRVTTAWNDPAGAPQAEVLNPRDPQLVNNLDLVVYRLDGNGDPDQTNLPWRLNPNVPLMHAQKAQNDVDNVLQVVTPSNVSVDTIYRVEIKQRSGTTIVGDDGVTPGYQPVSLVISGVLNRNIPFSITNQSYDFSGGQLVATLTWGSHAGEYYVIEFTDDLNQPWQPVSGIFNARADATTGSSAPITPIPDRAFFRVVKVSPDPFGYL